MNREETQVLEEKLDKINDRLAIVLQEENSDLNIASIWIGGKNYSENEQMGGETVCCSSSGGNIMSLSGLLANYLHNSIKKDLKVAIAMSELLESNPNLKEELDEVVLPRLMKEYANKMANEGSDLEEGESF